MFTRVSKQVLIPLVCISLLSLTAHMAGAQQLPVPNPSFESGIDAPDGWVLSRGEGIWLEEGTAGQRALGVVGTGADRDANFWVSTDIPMKPDTVYRLRFHARHVKGINGSLFTGPAFNNRDLPEMTGEWQRFTTYFSTPAVIPPDQSHLRFGQWDINGIAAFDAVELMETQPSIVDKARSCSAKASGSRAIATSLSRLLAANPTTMHVRWNGLTAISHAALGLCRGQFGRLPAHDRRPDTASGRDRGHHRLLRGRCARRGSRRGRSGMVAGR
ncbi:MAG: hypothetical protein ACOX52_09555 [Verrucomicrobiota bacterium]